MAHVHEGKMAGGNIILLLAIEIQFYISLIKTKNIFPDPTQTQPAKPTPVPFFRDSVHIKLVTS